MKNVAYTYWQDGDQWPGYLDQYPDYLTQGSSLDDLKEHLTDLHQEFSEGTIPSVRRHAQLDVA